MTPRPTSTSLKEKIEITKKESTFPNSTVCHQESKDFLCVYGEGPDVAVRT